MRIRLFAWLFLFFSMAAFGQNPNAIAPPGTVALTFDDGPSKEYTVKILAILKKYNIKATFFVVGDYVKEHPDILKMIAADGHAIDNHTTTHPFLTHLNNNQVNNEIQTTQDLIFKETGKKAACLRYPYGDYNKRVKDLIQGHQLQPIGIDVDSEDYRRPGVKKIVSNVLTYTKSGVVILFHDGPAARQETVDALPLIIDAIQKKGLKFSQICPD